MAILEQEVWIVLHPSNIDYFEMLGYEIPRKEDKRRRISVPRGTKILIKIEHLKKNSDIRVTKVCDICGKLVKNQTYQSIMISKEGDGKDYCFSCGKIKSAKSKKNNVKYENSFEGKANSNNLEYLLLEYSHKNINKPNEISFSTADACIWNCPNNTEHEYSMPLCRRTYGGNNCPYCSGMRLHHTNCLATTHPELAMEWDYEKNINLTPNDITGGIHTLIWWKCSRCNSSFDASPNNRTNAGSGCPYCAGVRVNQTNCLATTHPKISEEWHPTKNGRLTPFEVTRGSERKAWWLCSNCDYSYYTTIYSRTNGGRNEGGTGCPLCVSSKPEKEIFKILTLYDIPFQFNNSFANCKNQKQLPFDFVLFESDGTIKCIIEYDGRQHFECVNFGGDSEVSKLNFEQLKQNDKIKNKYCYDEHIPLYRIPYIDKYVISEIMESIISYHDNDSLEKEIKSNFLENYEFLKVEQNPKYYERVLKNKKYIR